MQDEVSIYRLIIAHMKWWTSSNMWEKLAIYNSIEEEIKRNGNQGMRVIMQCRIFCLAVW